MVRGVIVTSALATLFAAAAISTASAKDDFDLKGEVYAAGYRIEMKNGANQELTSVKAGTYRIRIEDEATTHNFHLKGPGVSKKTSVSGKSETIWTVTLKRGTYTYLCDPHKSTMRGTFRVT